MAHRKHVLITFLRIFLQKIVTRSIYTVRYGFDIILSLTGRFLGNAMIIACK